MDKKGKGKGKKEKGKKKVQLFKSHPLEGDGVLTNLYDYLWKKNKNLESCPLVIIPHTVPYEHNFPRGWFYYDEKNGELKKKTGKELDTKTIIREFTKGVKEDNEIVASYLSKKKGTKGREAVSVEFFNKSDFEEFMWKRSKKEEGVLQKFVIPKGNKIERKNSVIQAIWTSHIFTVERRMNMLKLDAPLSTHHSLYERAVTYEGPAHFSSEFFCAPQLRSKIEERCKSIVNHFKSTEHKLISRMVLYFKVDNDGKIWLLWGSSVRIASGGKSSGRALNLSPSFVQPARASSENERKLLGSPSSPKFTKKKVKTFIRCNNCGTTTQNKMEITTEKIVKHFKAEKAKAKMKMKEIEGKKTSLTDEEMTRIKLRKEVIESLDDLMYEVYSHFLVMSEDEEFAFKLPDMMSEEQKKDLETKFDHLGLKKNEDGEFTINYSSISIARFQREVENFKALLGGEDKVGIIHSPSFVGLVDTNRYIVQSEENKDKVPKVIQNSFPDINNESYKYLSKERLFLSRKIQICDICYEIFADENDREALKSLITTQKKKRKKRKGRRRKK